MRHFWIFIVFYTKELSKYVSMNNINIRYSVAFPKWQYKASVTIYTESWCTFSKGLNTQLGLAHCVVSTSTSHPCCCSIRVAIDSMSTSMAVSNKALFTQKKLYLQKSTNKYSRKYMYIFSFSYPHFICI